jgi:DNA-binding NarL/FixJ family response regulator
MAIVADRRLSLAALSALLLKDPGYRVTREADGLGEVRAMLAAQRPQVMVLDVSGPALFSVIDALPWGVRTLLLLDPHDDRAVFAGAANARVEGSLSRTATREQLEAAIATLDRSGSYLDPLLAAPTATLPRRGDSALSMREREILVWVASGRSTKEIARACAIAPKTVANHVNNMSQKLNLRHRGQLVLYAAQQGLTTI